MRELRGAGYDLSDLGPLLDGATDAPEKAGSLAEILAEFERAPRRLLRPGRRAAGGRARRGSTGSALLVWGMLDLPPALERLLRGDRRADAGRRLSRRMCRRPRTPRWPSCAARLIAGGATRAATSADARARARRSSGSGGACSRRRRRRRSRRTGRCGWCRRRTRRARCARRRGRALQWAREGVPFWEMAVAYRHGEAYLPLVEAVFVEAGIPVYLHEGSPLAERPLGRQTLGAARAVRLRPLAPVGDGLPDRRAASRRSCTRSTAGSRRRGGTRSRARRGSSQGAEQWQRRLAALQRDLTRTTSDDARLGAPSGSRTPVGSRGSSPSSTGRLRDRPGAGAVGRASRLPAGPAGALRRRRRRGRSSRCAGSSGSPRSRREVDFDWFLDVVERAIGTLRSEDVIDRPAGGVRARAA